MSEADLAKLGYRITGDTERAVRVSKTPPPTYEPARAADIFPAIKRLATQHGWDNRYTYNATDDETGRAIDNDPGLLMWLIRDETALCAYLFDEGMGPTLIQQRWIDVARMTGHVEAHIWYPADFETIKARLTQPRKGESV